MTIFSHCARVTEYEIHPLFGTEPENEIIVNFRYRGRSH